MYKIHPVYLETSCQSCKKLFRDIKSLIFHAQHKRKYSHVKIGFGSRVIDSTFDGDHSEVGKDCYILRSSFGKGAMVKDGCAIFDSSFDSHTAVYHNCTLSHVKYGAYSYLADNSAMGNVTLGR